MPDREKLIELLDEAEEHAPDICVYNIDCKDCPGGKYGNKCRDYLKADYLIYHGVTVRDRGRWIPHYETFDADAAVGILGGNYQTGWQCSVCGRYELGKEPYCNCGADMRGEEDA